MSRKLSPHRMQLPDGGGEREVRERNGEEIGEGNREGCARACVRACVRDIQKGYT